MSVSTVGADRAAAPQVSVIIPTHNRPAALRCAIDSVVAQNMPERVEIIVINDGAAFDPSAVEEAARSHRITIVDPAEHLGPSRARNLGIDCSRGANIAFLDDDDVFLEQHLGAALAHMAASKCPFVYMGALVSERRVTPHGAARSGQAYKTYEYDPELLSVVNYIHTSSIVVKNFRDSNVRFDPALTVCEDWDMWLSLTKGLGFDARYGRLTTSVYHQIPDEQGLVARAQMQSPSEFTKARRYVYEKWPHSSPLAAVFRSWMMCFETYRDDLIAAGRPMPNLLFDSVLDYVSNRLGKRTPPNEADIRRFFDATDEQPG